METRADEFDQYMQMLRTLSSEKKSLSPNDQKTLEKIKELQDEWNFVIDSVDQEFKK